MPQEKAALAHGHHLGSWQRAPHLQLLQRGAGPVLSSWGAAPWAGQEMGAGHSAPCRVWVCFPLKEESRWAEQPCCGPSRTARKEQSKLGVPVNRGCPASPLESLQVPGSLPCLQGHCPALWTLVEQHPFFLAPDPRWPLSSRAQLLLCAQPLCFSWLAFLLGTPGELSSACLNGWGAHL